MELAALTAGRVKLAAPSAGRVELAALRAGRVELAALTIVFYMVLAPNHLKAEGLPALRKLFRDNSAARSLCGDANGV